MLGVYFFCANGGKRGTSQGYTSFFLFYRFV
nr:MAG TPA: hypothetical protein [Caudoviricetes sp.]